MSQDKAIECAGFLNKTVSAPCPAMAAAIAFGMGIDKPGEIFG